MDVREKLVELLSEYFDIGDSYAYNLTRVKSAFACGTMGFDDFEEFDDETVADIADHLIANGVTVQEWISVKEDLPKDRDWVLVNHTGYATPKKAKYKDDFSPHLPVFLIDGDNGNKGEVTHWMPLPPAPEDMK